MNSLKQSILATAAVLTAVEATLAGGTLYCVRESDNVLVKIDLDTLVFTDIGPLNTGGDFGGMAYDPAGTMYLVPGRGNNSLYTVDLNTGNATAVGSHGVNDLFGLAFDTSTSTLYGTQFSGGTGFYRLNTSTGAATFIGDMGRGIGGLAYDGDRDRLIGVQDGNGDLYEINRANGSVSLLFDGPYTNDSGLAWDPDRDYLWGIDWNGVLYYFDIANGFARTDVRTNLGAHDCLEFVGELSGYRLRLSGACPGTVTVSWSGATPSRQQGIVYGANQGSTTIPGGACQGTVLGIQGQVRLVNTVGTGSGSGSVNGRAGTAACGHYLQLVESGSCNTSNVSQIP